jgi:serine/threonine-protein kinase
MRDPLGIVGTTIDRRYAIRRAVAEGGFGVVYEAEAVALGVTVAIKVLRSEIVERSPEARARFAQEARLLARLRHPGIVGLGDASTLDDGTPYLALEWIDGETLDAFLARVGPLPLDVALDLLGPVAHAIAYAHDEGVVHRDLKPANVMVDRSRAAKVLDFGVARWTAPMGMRTTTTTGTGLSIGFAAPEQYGKDFGPVDGRADQFALAAVVYAALSARPPFEGESLHEVMYATCFAPQRPRLAALRPDLPPALDDVLGRAFAIKPTDRFPDVRAFWRALEEVARSGARAAGPVRGPETDRASMPLRSIASRAPEVVTLPSPEVAAAPRTEVSAPIGFVPTVPVHALAEGSPRERARAPIAADRTGGALPSAGEERNESGDEPIDSVTAPSSRLPRRASWAIGGVAVLVVGGAAVVAAWPIVRPPRSSPPPRGDLTADPLVPTSATSGPLSTDGPCGAVAETEVCVPGGRLHRGPFDCATAGNDPAHRAACPATSVDLRPFVIDRFEVSVARWATCVAAGKCRAVEAGPKELPVRGIDAREAADFCAFARGRLPTDDEWEFAAAGGVHREYPWGNEQPSAKLAVFAAPSSTGESGAAPIVAVDALPAGATPDGIHALAGNVAEWTATLAPVGAPWPFGLDPPQPSAQSHGTARRWVRGGGADSLPASLRTWAREAFPESHRSEAIGFRCARDVPRANAPLKPRPPARND